jgi:phosphatidylglycerol---prolipoprotein diacylglyceryl transferase
MFDIPPDPVAFQLGPITIGWYGLCYAIGLAAAYVALIRLARAAGEDPDIVGNGIIIVSIAALIGGRLYHVIDQWALYANDPLKIILPPYSGLGVFGGIVTGTLAAWWYARRRGVSFARWADIIAPALFVMQAIGRWGNYFNQELYGPPTTAPWGIPIDCAHRLVIYSCDTLPETTRFHPLFLYESISGLLGAAFLVFLGYRLRSWLRPGDLLLTFFIWYGVTRFALETLRADNWTFFGVPTAQVVSLAFIAIGVVGMVLRHRGSRMGDKPPPYPQRATWGALGAAWMTRPIDEPWANVGDRIDDDADDEAHDESADDRPDDIDTDVVDEPGPTVDDDAAAPDQTEPRPSP